MSWSFSIQGDVASVADEAERAIRVSVQDASTITQEYGRLVAVATAEMIRALAWPQNAVEVACYGHLNERGDGSHYSLRVDVQMVEERSERTQEITHREDV